MIFSENINKVCGLCENAEFTDDTHERVHCSILNKDCDIADAACDKFSYDIFKKRVHRRRAFKPTYNPDDFKL